MLKEWLAYDAKYPHGAMDHLEGASAEVRTVLQRLFADFKDIFPSELPTIAPPDRGVGDVHKIPLVEGSVPPVKKMYR